MVEIQPFNGIRYNVDIIGEIGNVVAPPYDVISPEEQDVLYQKSPYNAVRLILGKEKAEDTVEHNRYSRAHEYFEEWQIKNILERDTEKSIYVYEQRYMLDGKKINRMGFVGLFRLSEFGQGILPHEKILKGPILDRLKLMRSTKGQFGQIFSLYDDEKKVVDHILADNDLRVPLFKMKDQHGVEHEMWSISDSGAIKKIQKVLAGCILIIADGHHRYTTALEYSKENQDNPEAKYTMMTFVNAFHKGLQILPTNRLIHGLSEFDEDDFVVKLEKFFEIIEVPRENDLIAVLEKDRSYKFGISIPKSKRYLMLELKDDKILAEYLPEKPPAYRKLHVVLAHKLILESGAGLNEELQHRGDNVTYVKGNEDTVQMLESGDFNFGLFIKPPTVMDVFATAREGEVMPQKATYFFPKIWSGFVLNKMS